MIRTELSYLRNVICARYDQSLHDELFSAGLERLAKALYKSTSHWSAYMRCAMHSGIMTELRQHLSRRTRFPAVALEEADLVSPSPETLLLLKEACE